MIKVLKNVEPLVRSYLGDAFCFSIISDYNIPKGLDIEFLKYPIHWTLTIRNPLS